MAVKGLRRHKTVAEILSGRGLLSEDQLKEADANARKNGKPLQQAVLDANFVGKSVLLKALSEEWQVKAVDLDQMEIDAEIVKIIPEAVARRHRAVPFAKEESTLFVAMADPRDFFVSEDLQLRTGLSIQPYLAIPQDVRSAIDGAYGNMAGEVVHKLIQDVVDKQAGPELVVDSGVELRQEQEKKAEITEVDASAPEVEKIVNAVILGALSMKASDIHIEPFEDPAGKLSKILLRYRVDGQLVPGPFTVPWSYRHAVSAKIKIMTNSMNITERRVPQSGRIQLLAQGDPIEFRVEMVPTVYGESCVMRILDRKSVQVDIMKMGFLKDTLDKFLSLLKGIGGKKNFGLILVCGPTGSGKSTTLYAALNHVNRPDIKILTAENPVEYNLDGIVQVPVNPDLKLGEGKKFDFATALRSFLRLDPDVIMVGEIRDEETAHIAMEAAMTGHLVFSTLHTNDSSSAISRLADMGLPAFMVATTVKAVLAQRLSRRLCADCKIAHDPTPEEVQIFKLNGVSLPSAQKIYGPPPDGGSCAGCKGLGFRGRVGLHELLVMSDALRGLCLKDVAADPLREQARKEGLRLIVQDGLEKVKLGLTTVREVLGGTE
ncbi:MAG: Flp pilus assembly complex ATPase component TadA [Elusimicrobia bacterium]|nr:Flp pilus assembly complex ATPase component TadA [Elusimicrobiota bacterium]MDE2424729.1 Flp pilus assembly complex ATPase component TadA [Elusimicrobiota bacterium]